MIKFEQIGVNMQYDSNTVKEAESKFSRSCDICCHRGLHISCDRCVIAEAHKLTVAAIQSLNEKSGESNNKIEA